MLKSVRIRNFRCFREVKVPLRPLTILIGPNDSGKSAFLAGLNGLSGSLELRIEDCWRFQEKTPALVTGETDDGAIRLVYGEAPSARPPPNQLRPSMLFQLPSNGVAMASRGYSDQGAPPVLEDNGGMVPALLDYLLRRRRERFSDFVDAMRGLVPGLEGVEIATPDASNRSIDLIIDDGFRIPAERSSAGVRLLLFFLALAYHPEPPKLIFLEEPENGVHPKRLRDVMGLLREVTQGKHGDQAAQIVLTTHSPHLLDYVDIEQDQVLVFRRNDDGSRTAEPADESRLKNFLDEFMLGEVWFNEGEAGLVGRGP